MDSGEAWAPDQRWQETIQSLQSLSTEEIREKYPEVVRVVEEIAKQTG